MDAERRIARANRTKRLISPLLAFTELEASSGILLIICTVAALILANSSLSTTYFDLIHAQIGLSFGANAFAMSVEHWINDLLMAIFFLVVGLEIKREVLIGELRSVRQAALPIAAAIGGMVFPAILFLSLNAGKPSASGWGVPMATDIAFSLGVLALLGSRIPVSLKVMLTALAIVDDLGAVVVIAIAYTDAINWMALGWGAALLMVLIVLNRTGVRSLLPYLAIGLGVWVCFLASGVHATIAGVLVAMTIPIWQRVPDTSFSKQARKILDRYDEADEEEREFHVGQLENVCEHVQMPAQRLEHLAHPWVTYLIIPVFALANAGVRLPADALGQLVQPIPAGVVIGLVLGKPIGIVFASFLAMKLRLAQLPSGVGWGQVIGLGFLAGIGFTMSIFIANLAFDAPQQVEAGKVGILVGSLFSGLIGYFLLKRGKVQSSG